jgi:protease-4
LKQEMVMKNYGWLIALSIVAGIVLVCAIVPLGAFGIMVAAGSNTAGTVPEMRWQEQIVSGTGTERVVIIEVSGTIGMDDAGSFFATQLTHDQLLSQIRQAREDEQVKAVVLRVESPGGGVVASNELHRALQDLREAGKHLVISMGNTAASGGYYIATAGERIYANPDTLTGSLGVIMSLTNVEETYDKLGLRQFTYKSGELKDIGSPFHEPTPKEEAILQSIIDQAYQGFVDVIVEGRNLPREEVLEIADGRIYTGQQALELGLIDEFGNREDAVEGAKELAGLEEARVVRYTRTGTLRDLLLATTERLQSQSDPLGLRTMLEPQAPRLEYRMAP